MRDLHFDGEYLRDFNEASKKWPWATWHQVRAAQETTAQRLLEQVFNCGDELPRIEGAAEDED